MRRPIPWTGAGAPASVRVLLLSAETLFGEAVSMCLGDNDGVEVVGLTLDPATVVQAVEVLRPTVLVVDQRSLAAAPDAIAAARLVHESLRTVLLATVATPTSAETVSFDQVVPPQSSLDRVVASVREVAWYVTRVAPVEAASSPDLTPRELEILRLLARGTATAAIAQQLHLSPHTVRNHVRGVLAKLSAHSRIEAVSEARRFGLV